MLHLMFPCCTCFSHLHLIHKQCRHVRVSVLLCSPYLKRVWVPWQQAVINGRSPTLLWIDGLGQTIAVVGTLEEQLQLLNKGLGPLTGAAGCRWPGGFAGVEMSGMTEHLWRPPLHADDFTVSLFIRDKRSSRMMTERGSDLAALTVLPRSTCLPNNTGINTRPPVWRLTCLYFPVVPQT